MSFGQFQFRRDTAANWTSANPTLLSGEMGIETDTSKYKIGNGSTAWVSLAYGGTQGTAGVGVPTGGTANQVLVKTSSTDYADAWTTFNDTVHGSLGGGTDHAVATTSTAGFMAAADKTKLNGLVTGLNGWIDVTQQTAPVLTSNSAATNNTNLTAIMTAATSGSTLYFPGGFYPFASVIAIPAKVFTFQGAMAGLNGNLTALNWTSNVAGDLMTLTNANYYTQFKDMTFLTSITQTAGAVINVGDNANINFYRCVFTGLSSTQTLKDCINYTGTHAGEISIVQACTFTSFTGTGIIGGSNLSTVVIDGCTMNGAQVAACGINIQLGGAFQIDNSDIIGCTNNLLINPTTGNVVASVWVANTYFDSSQGSCIKISGAGATVRTKFTGCSFTTAGTASPNNAVEVSSTYAYGALGQGLDFINCNILNTFASGGTASGTGFNITGAADFNIIGCNIALWTVGIDITPASSAGMTQPLIQGNSIGPCGGYGGNTTGIRLNAGSFAYGQYSVQNNNLQGNTTAITDNSTLGTGTAALGQRNIDGNTGLIVAPTANYAATAIPTGSVVTNVDSRGGMLIPAGARASSGRISVFATNAATAQTLTVTVRYGVNNSNADAAVFTFAHTLGTAVVGSGRFVVDWELLTSTTMGITYFFGNGNNAATGIAAGTATVTSALSTPATIATSANDWLGVYFSSTAAAITIRSVKYEIQSQ